jgi:hypothetical protein
VTKEEQIAYGKLYDIVNDNKKQIGDEFKYSREIFLADVCQAPEQIDVARLKDVPDEDYALAAYMVCTSREPSAETIDRWKQSSKTIDSDELRKSVLKEVWGSLLMVLNYATFQNNPYFSTKLSIKHQFIYFLSQVRRNRKVLLLLQKMPKGIIELGRKLVG